MSLKKQALHGFFWTFLEKFSSKIVSFGVSIILARLILPEEFGLLGLTYIFTGVATVLVSSGLSNSLIRSENLDNSDYSTVFYFNVGISLTLYLILFFLAPYIALFYNEDRLTLIIQVYSLIFIFNAFGSIQKTILTIELNFKRQMTVTLPALIVSSALAVWLAYYGYGVWSLVWSAVVYSIMVALQYWFYTKWKPLWIFSKEKFKTHFNFGYKLTLAGLVNILLINAYYVIIGKFFTLTQVGYYQRAESLKDLPVSNLSVVLDQVTYPIFSKIQNDPDKLRDAYKLMMQLAIFAIAPVMAILIVIADTLFVTLYTEKWLSAAPFFQIMAVAAILFPIQAYNVNILKIKGRTDLVFKIVLFTRVLSIGLIFAAFSFGIYVLLWTQLVTAVLFFVIYSYFSGKLIDYSTWKQIKDIIPSVLLATLIGVLLHFVYIYLAPFGNIWRLLISIVLGFTSYLCAAYILKMKQLLYLLDLMKSRK
jgi:O-antigen/teichoic acid export membrane protein